MRLKFGRNKKYFSKTKTSESTFFSISSGIDSFNKWGNFFNWILNCDLEWIFSFILIFQPQSTNLWTKKNSNSRMCQQRNSVKNFVGHFPFFSSEKFETLYFHYDYVFKSQFKNSIWWPLLNHIDNTEESNRINMINTVYVTASQTVYFQC